MSSSFILLTHLNHSIIGAASHEAVQSTVQHQAHHAPSLAVTLFFTAILVALILCLAFEEKIHAQKSVIASFFALISLICATFFDLLPYGPNASSKGAAPLINTFNETLFHPIFIQGIDWGVIAIIFGASLFVDLTSKSGLFTWIALKLIGIHF